MTGTLPRIFFNNAGDRLKLLSIDQWGSSIAWESMSRAFPGCENVELHATDVPNLSNVTNMYQMFYVATSLTTNAAMNSWDTTNINDMTGVFMNASNFNQDIGN